MSDLDSKVVIFGLFGAGGYAREVMPIVVENLDALFKSKPNVELKVFFVEVSPNKKEVNGYPIVSEDEFFNIECDVRYFNVAIADSKIRAKVSNDILGRGVIPLSLLADNTIVYHNNDISDGAIICANCVVTSNVKIGKFFHANIYSYVAHDCVIGDFVTFAPNVHCNGNVHIKDHAYIGTGAIIKQGSEAKPLIIGEGAVVGMGAVVTKDVEPFTTVVGNPARLHSANK
jgi:sugar O-acyltransferase (sialic acid O-acetyltransferase NeuD family)